MSPKKKRVEFKKNRGSKDRPRFDSKLTQDDDSALDQLTSSERMSGKGDKTRYRTIIEDSADESTLLSGRVIRAIGANSCTVRTDDGHDFTCTVRKVLRAIAQSTRSAVVAGDLVQLKQTAPNEGVIHSVRERKGILSRAAKDRQHIIAANVDQMVIVASARNPNLKPNLIDRFLVVAEKHEINPIICINKMDLADVTKIESIANVYRNIGYDVLLTSIQTGQGIAELRSRMENKITVFTGQSGVGKSSLLNSLLPELALRTHKVSTDTGKGQHTTTTAQLIPFANNSWLVDTPGIRQMELWDTIPEEVEAYFREFLPFVPNCKFPDCSHTHEANCAVKAAVDSGHITPNRYQSYTRLYHGDPPTKEDEEDDLDF